MAQLTPMGLIKIMGLVTLIMVVPMVGGVVAGLVLDELLGTSPLLVLSGVVIGSLRGFAGADALAVQDRQPITTAAPMTTLSRTGSPNSTAP